MLVLTSARRLFETESVELIDFIHDNSIIVRCVESWNCVRWTWTPHTKLYSPTVLGKFAKYSLNGMPFTCHSTFHLTSGHKRSLASPASLWLFFSVFFFLWSWLLAYRWQMANCHFMLFSDENTIRFLQQLRYLCAIRFYSVAINIWLIWRCPYVQPSCVNHKLAYARGSCLPAHIWTIYERNGARS